MLHVNRAGTWPPWAVRSRHMDKRYTIFVSSTYTDMIDERNAVIQAIMRAGHIPLGMEAFGAANASSWKVITKTIDAADYYVLLIARRYGSLNKAVNLGYTEQEFMYAVETGVPVLVFLLQDTASWPGHYTDTDADAVRRLKAFRARASADRQVAFWAGKSDLPFIVMTSLGNAFSDDPRPGWIRPVPGASLEVTEQLARVIKEKDELRELLDERQADRRIERIHDRLVAVEFEMELEGKPVPCNAAQIFAFAGQILSQQPMQAQYMPFSVINSMNRNLKPGTPIPEEVRTSLTLIANLGLTKTTLGEDPSDSSKGHIKIVDLTDAGRDLLRELVLR